MNLLWPYKRLTIYYSKHHQGTYKYHFNFPRCQHCFPTRSSICSLLPQERGSQSVSSKLEMGLAMAVSHIGTRLGYCAGILSVVCHLPSMTKYFSHLADKVTNDRQTDRQTSIYLSVCLSVCLTVCLSVHRPCHLRPSPPHPPTSKPGIQKRLMMDGLGGSTVTSRNRHSKPVGMADYIYVGSRIRSER
jgi:hypothetical protein